MSENTGEGVKDIDQIKKIGLPWKEGATSINWDQICFVRAIKDPRQISVVEKNGTKRLVAQSVLTSSKGESARTTTHWSINHKVSPHMFGTWDDSSLIIISPGKEMIKENGLPFSMASFDTYWEKDLIIPQSSTIIYGPDLPENILNIKKVRFVRTIIRKEIVNKEIKHLGYTVEKEDIGTYSHTPGFDAAIYGLAENEGILQIGGHTETPIWYLEKASDCLSSERDYEEAINLAISGIENSKDEELPIGEKAISVFCGKLFNVFKKYPEKILNNKEALVNTLIFFDKNPDIGNVISEWANKDRENNKQFKDLISITNFFNSDEDKSKFEEFIEGDSETLNLIRKISENNHEFAKQALKDYFWKSYESNVSVEVKPVKDDSYSFLIKFLPF